MDERQKITEDSLTKHNFIIRDYFLRGIVLTSDFLDDLKEMDPFMYDRLANRENIPKNVIDWFKYLVEEKRKGKFTARKTNAF